MTSWSIRSRTVTRPSFSTTSRGPIGSVPKTAIQLTAIRTDTRLKNFPYRERLVQPEK